MGCGQPAQQLFLFCRAGRVFDDLFCLHGGGRPVQAEPAPVWGAGVPDGAGLLHGLCAAGSGGTFAGAEPAHNRSIQWVRLPCIRQRPAVPCHFLQRFFDAGCPLPERPVPGGHLKAHQHDRLLAGGGHCGRAGVLPRAAAPPLCAHHESVPYLRLCAGAEQHVLCPQFQLLCALVLYAGFGALRRHGYDAAKSQPVRNRVPPRAGPCGAVYLEQHCLCAGAQ